MPTECKCDKNIIGCEKCHSGIFNIKNKDIYVPCVCSNHNIETVVGIDGVINKNIKKH